MGTPIRVEATLRSGVTSLPSLDALLAAKVADVMGLPPQGFAPMVDIEIPIAREPGGRFHLATVALVEWEQHERRHINRKFPLAEAQMLGAPSVKRVHIGAGACKSYRIPSQVSYATDDTVTWFAIATDVAAVRELLQLVTHLGRRRAVGRGSVVEWRVVECEPWDDGFPVVQHGKPLRPLPPDWPGLEDPKLGHAVITYPYWMQRNAQVCAVPA